MLRDGATDNALPEEDIHDRSAVTDEPLKSDKSADAEDEDSWPDLYLQLKDEIVEDIEHWNPWYKQADDDTAFVASHQYTEDEKQQLEEQGRPDVVFNRTQATVESIVGLEIGNRREVQYIPRKPGDAEKNEKLTSVGQWVRDECDAEDEESDMFWDVVTAGLGHIETRMSYDEDPEGMCAIERLPYREVVNDRNARKRNLIDQRRVSRLRNVSCEEARSILAGVTDKDFDDGELDASWARSVGKDDKDGQHSSDPEDAYDPNNDTQSDDEDDDSKGEDGKPKITLVHTQWWTHERGFKIPWQGSVETLSQNDYKRLNERMRGMGQPEVRGVRVPMKVYKQAWIGSKILWSGPAACPGHFTIETITGKRDPKAGTWYGIVRTMRDPQRWANKWLAQGMHIMNTAARNGYFYEKGVFEDPEKAEATIAQTGTLTEVKKGTFAAQALQPKTSAGFPADMMNLMQFAISSIRDASGVNLELLGLKDQEQAGVLEAQRKQAGMTILAMFFDALRRYRKRQGKVMLYFITHYLGDGRLVKILGEDGKAQYIPFFHEPDTEEYDVIVDDSPTSPNQKEQVWQAILQMMPFIGKGLDEGAMLALAKWSPLPTSVVQDLTKASAQKAEANKPDADRAKELAFKEQEAKINELNARAGKAMADAQRPAPGQPGPEPLEPGELEKAAADVRKAEANATKAEFDAYASEIALHQGIAQPGIDQANADRSFAMDAASDERNAQLAVMKLGSTPATAGASRLAGQNVAPQAGQRPAPAPAPLNGQVMPAQPQQDPQVAALVEQNRQIMQMLGGVTQALQVIGQGLNGVMQAHGQTSAQMAAMQAENDADIIVHRDPDGHATAVQKGSKVRKIRKNPRTNKIEGATA